MLEGSKTKLEMEMATVKKEHRSVINYVDTDPTLSRERGSRFGFFCYLACLK